MIRRFPLPGAAPCVPEVEAWFVDRPLADLVRPWFVQMRACGPDVRELLHDGAPTVCVGELAFAYVNAWRAHAAVGFFLGPEDLPDPAGLLEGTGRTMRHVKLRPGVPVDPDALAALIAEAYQRIRAVAD